MNGFRVDPDALTAASRVAQRQDDHVRRIDSYVGSACSDLGAFSGVLNLFQASYESALATAHEGLADSRAVAQRVESALIDTRQDYLDTDREAFEWFKERFGHLVDFPVYQPPGSGDTTPDGPYGGAPGAQRPGADPDSAGLPKPPWWVDKPGGQLFPGERGDTPPWLDPKQALRDAGADAWRRNVGDEYDYYRSLGYSDREALELARADHPNSDTRADTQVYDQVQDRARGAYNAAYTEAINDGATDREARAAGNEAASRQLSEDAHDRSQRQDVRNDVGTYRQLYDEGRRTVEGVQNLGENVETINDNAEDLDRYDDYESRDEDESAQEWANR